MVDRKEILTELKENYNKCSELFDIAYCLNSNENTRTEFSRKVTSYMSDVIQTLGFLIDEIIDDIEIEKEIQFPFQYMNQYLRGESDWDSACDNTIDEVYKLIEEYADKKLGF